MPVQRCSSSKSFAIVRISSCLILLACVAACDTGHVYVAKPQVHTRERLVSERSRNHQWLIKQLERTDDITTTYQGLRDFREFVGLYNNLAATFDPAQGALDQITNETRESNLRTELYKSRGAELAARDEYIRRLEASEADEGDDTPLASPSPGTATTANADSVTLPDLTAPPLGSRPNEFPLPDPSALVPTEAEAHPIDLFADRAAYRDAVNAAIRSNQLDDSHDAAGGELYELTLSTTLTPGGRSSRYAQVELKLHQTPFENRVSGLAALFQDWVGALQGQLVGQVESLQLRIRAATDGRSDVEELTDPERKILRRFILGGGRAVHERISRELESINENAQRVSRGEEVWSPDASLELYSVSPEVLLQQTTRWLLKSELKMYDPEIEVGVFSDLFDLSFGTENKDSLGTLLHDLNTTRYLQGRSNQVVELESYSPDQLRQVAAWAIWATHHFSLSEIVTIRSPLFDDHNRITTGSLAVRPRTPVYLPSDLETNEIQSRPRMSAFEQGQAEINESRRRAFELPSIQDTLQAPVITRDQGGRMPLLSQFINPPVDKTDEGNPGEQTELTSIDVHGNLPLPFVPSQRLWAELGSPDHRDATDEAMMEQLNDPSGKARLKMEYNDLVARYGADRITKIERDYARFFMSGNTQSTPAETVAAVLSAEIIWESVWQAGEIVNTLAETGPKEVGFPVFALRLYAAEGRQFAATVRPKEQAQNVSETAARESFLNLIAAVNATLPSSGVSASNQTQFVNRSQTLLHGITRQPLVVGYGDGEQKFGWMLGPSFEIMKGKAKFRHRVARHDVSAGVVIPGWRSTVQLSGNVRWIDASGEPTIDVQPLWGDGPDSGGGVTLELPFPNDASVRITRALLSHSIDPSLSPIISRPAPRIVSVIGAVQTVAPDKTVSAGTPYQEILVIGENLWRNPQIFLGGAKADSIEILSDMSGIRARFQRVVGSGERTALPVTVVTAYGSDRVAPGASGMSDLTIIAPKTNEPNTSGGATPNATLKTGVIWGKTANLDFNSPRPAGFSSVELAYRAKDKPMEPLKTIAGNWHDDNTLRFEFGERPNTITDQIFTGFIELTGRPPLPGQFGSMTKTAMLKRPVDFAWLVTEAECAVVSSATTTNYDPAGVTKDELEIGPITPERMRLLDFSYPGFADARAAGRVRVHFLPLPARRLEPAVTTAEYLDGRSDSTYIVRAPSLNVGGFKQHLVEAGATHTATPELVFASADRTARIRILDTAGKPIVASFKTAARLKHPAPSLIAGEGKFGVKDEILTPSIERAIIIELAFTDSESHYDNRARAILNAAKQGQSATLTVRNGAVEIELRVELSTVQRPSTTTGETYSIARLTLTEVGSPDDPSDRIQLVARNKWKITEIKFNETRVAIQNMELTFTKVE